MAGQSSIAPNNRVVAEQTQPATATQSQTKSNSVNNRVETSSRYNKDVVFSRAEKSNVNPSIGQYLITENIVKRDAIQSLVGLDVYV